MRNYQVLFHEEYLHPAALPEANFVQLLAQRRQRLISLIEQEEREKRETDEDDGRSCERSRQSRRTYPLVAVLAPALETNEGKIEYPGDPMCLYSALSVAVNEVRKAQEQPLSQTLPAREDGPYLYNDLCPEWGELPDHEYRQTLMDSGIRKYPSDARNSDQTVFDPRVWNEETRQYFIKHVLLAMRPRVVLISTVSPAHRYALDIAAQVRRYLPETLIIMGGRHIDETMTFQDEKRELSLAYSSTLAAIDDGRVGAVVDFLISGDGYFALDLLMKAISLAMDLERRTATVAAVVSVLKQLAPLMGTIPGRAVLVALEDASVHVFPVRGPDFDLAQLPSPYRAFGIRARFPIFTTEQGHVARTAHMMVTSACPYHCNFCSEGSAVVSSIRRFAQNPIAAAMDRVLEYVSYGAQALFFDDSIFWAGNTRRMIEFCRALCQVKAEAAEFTPGKLPWLRDRQDYERLRTLQWGAQLTAEFLTTIHARSRILECLAAMKTAGCSYIYMGIESMASSVMQHVHKNLSQHSQLSWAEKIRLALITARESGIRVGSSVLFGLDGETQESIEITIEQVGQLIDQGLLYLASPNILTYHPATPITRLHEKEELLDYHSLNVVHRPPYLYFEEAFPGVVSRALTEEDIWYIHRRTGERWGSGRYTTSLPPVPTLPG